MSNRYSVQIITPIIASVIVVADSKAEAQERALRCEGSLQEQRTEDAHIQAVERLEE